LILYKWAHCKWAMARVLQSRISLSISIIIQSKFILSTQLQMIGWSTSKERERERGKKMCTLLSILDYASSPYNTFHSTNFYFIQYERKEPIVDRTTIGDCLLALQSRSIHYRQKEREREAEVVRHDGEEIGNSRMMMLVRDSLSNWKLDAACNVRLL
jgi:hypothetical protein